MRVLRLDPVRQPGRDRRERPAEQEKSVKWNSLLRNLTVFHTAIDMMEVIRQLVAEGWQVTAEDLAQLSPFTPTRYVEVRRRFLREHPGHALDSWPLPAD